MKFTVEVIVGIIACGLFLQSSSTSKNDSHADNQSYADVLFALDYSSSTNHEEVDRYKDILRSAANHLSIGPDAVHMGIILYRCKAVTHLNLSQGTSRNVVMNSIYSLPAPTGGWDVIGAAMDKAVEIFTKKARNDSVKVFVLISDGETDCHPGEYDHCFGEKDGWSVDQCRTKGRQCARPVKFKCNVSSPWAGCGGMRELNSAVYDQAENLKRKLGVLLLTVRIRKTSRHPDSLVNMECWATDNMSILATNKDQADKLGETIDKAIQLKPAKDCRYSKQEEPCKMSADDNGTIKKCTKEIKISKISEAEYGGAKCPKSPITETCDPKKCQGDDELRKVAVGGGRTEYNNTRLQNGSPPVMFGLITVINVAILYGVLGFSAHCN